jgi:hypothetical protein
VGHWESHQINVLFSWSVQWGSHLLEGGSVGTKGTFNTLVLSSHEPPLPGLKQGIVDPGGSPVYSLGSFWGQRAWGALVVMETERHGKVPIMGEFPGNVGPSTGSQVSQATCASAKWGPNTTALATPKAQSEGQVGQHFANS